VARTALGKTTVSRTVLAETLGDNEFVNADAIATGLSGFAPDAVAFQAGRVMIARLRALASSRATFAFESTLASRTFVPWLRELVEHGYRVHLIYVWVRSPEIAVARVRQRARGRTHRARRRGEAKVRETCAQPHPRPHNPA
jgi:predicted ABC-type ATPase